MQSGPSQTHSILALEHRRNRQKRQKDQARMQRQLLALVTSGPCSGESRHRKHSCLTPHTFVILLFSCCCP